MTKLTYSTSITRKGTCVLGELHKNGEKKKRDEMAPSLLRCCYADLLFIFVNVDGSAQLVNIFLSPNWVMLLLQIGVIVRWLDFWVFLQTRKESPPAKSQAPHSLICCQQFIATFHDLSFRIPSLYLLDIQHVKSYNMFKSIKQSMCTRLLNVLYTMITRSCNPLVR
jgi:hypothetical protein